MCLEPSREHRSAYLPIIEDYIAKNRKKLRLERKFNLPQYALVGPNGIYSGLPFSTSVIFHISAIGFNPDRTRALVYVGRDCGSLCGGGSATLICLNSKELRDSKNDVKTWTVDPEEEPGCIINRRIVKRTVSNP